jgi:hypothetical protein
MAYVTENAEILRIQYRTMLARPALQVVVWPIVRSKARIEFNSGKRGIEEATGRTTIVDDLEEDLDQARGPEAGHRRSWRP